ncbi:hypothetical protein BJ138DRAFT_757923 [Hygrophoropsis aurantiaca]|uniref:Uncharacterized protein n=1 Tax=Hygrophoropsis aurantiaca TaxID=72124 RepID=A0ACB7ZX67_9AGAM|nr:hypothetical protein BJ138DRAFT_757923 [Hygrophoropsis aurantiaca]
MILLLILIPRIGPANGLSSEPLHASRGSPIRRPHAPVVHFTTPATAHTSSMSTQPSSDTATGSYTSPTTTSAALTASTTVFHSTLYTMNTTDKTYIALSSSQRQTTSEIYTMLPSPHGQTILRSLTATSASLITTSGNHPMTSRGHTPSLGIIAGSAAGGTVVLLAAIFTAFCVVRRRAGRRKMYDDNRSTCSENDMVQSDSNSNSSLPADLESSHEYDALVVTPVDHDGEIIPTATVPSSTTAIVLSTSLPTSPRGVPISIAPENSFPDLGSNSNPNLHQEPYQYLQRDPHPDCFSEHEVYTPCPSYSCISLRENNCTIGPTSPQWYGREGRGRWSDGEGGRGTTRGRGRSRSRSRSRPIARRTNIPSRSTAGSEAVSRAGTWMTASERSTETAPPSYDHANHVDILPDISDFLPNVDIYRVYLLLNRLFNTCSCMGMQHKDCVEVMVDPSMKRILFALVLLSNGNRKLVAVRHGHSFCTPPQKSKNRC